MHLLQTKSSMLAALVAGSIVLTACTDDGGPVTGLTASVETVPVASTDDAADDPAIWVHPINPGKSLILGTDKQAGLNVYRLDGSLQTFLPSGRLNNVDLRQNVQLPGFEGDLAAASNRSDDSITLFSVSADQILELGRFPSLESEPYGLCTGMVDNSFTVFSTHKNGIVIAYRVDGPSEASESGRYKFASQLEGCVFDEDNQVLYVGEEEYGIWRTTVSHDGFSTPTLVDRTGSETGLRADVEGLSLYRRPNGGGYLVASSQGNNSYVLYDRAGDNAFVTGFSITNNEATGIDGTQETDGLAVTSMSLGAKFPNGLLVVQDGINSPLGSTQNFKFIDWRRIADLIDSFVN